MHIHRTAMMQENSGLCFQSGFSLKPGVEVEPDGHWPRRLGAKKNPSKS